ncbi:MAG: redoxin domain-containing protein [Rubripirellula sp.]
MAAQPAPAPTQVVLRSRTAIQTRSPEPLKGIDLSGRLRRLGECGDTKGVVVTFLSTQCPISNGYLPRLNELAKQYSPLGIEFYGVVSDPSVSCSAATSHRQAYDIRFPVLFDGSGELRLALSPTHTPQTFVLNSAGRKLYSGAIDDRYMRVGQKKDVAAIDYLEDAINSVVNGNAIARPITKPVGCLLEDPPNKIQTGDVTYTRDIAPIIQANCSSCHRPGQSAPFPLLTYDDVSGHANQILEVTHSRFMPPWKPAPGFTRFLDELRLSKHELSLLKSWVDSGKPQGDSSDLPAPVKYADGWKLGQPDLVLSMQDLFPIPARGPDIRQYFVIPTGIVEDRLIAAIEFRPGTPQAVHHASFFLDTHHSGRKLDQADPSPGYEGFGGPRFESQGTLSSWFPGMTPRRLPTGMGRLFPAGSDIVAELHYVTTGKPEQDRSTIGLHFARSSAKQVVVEVQVGNKKINIPGGAERHLERAMYRLPVDTTLLDMVPHMHVLGREMKVWTRSPDGSTTPLMWIKDWDFNWQSQYSFAQPIHLSKGTELIVDAWYDNSAKNPLNPNSPPKTVRWGDDSTDEMLLCHFQCTCETMDELNTLVDDQTRYISTAQKR